MREEIRAEIGESDVNITNTLRMTWLSAQRADPRLIGLFKSNRPADFRVAEDGLLEKFVKVQNKELWVPVVPEGHAASHMTWKRWLYLQCHVGVLGAHRSGQKTGRVMERMAWW